MGQIAAGPDGNLWFTFGRDPESRNLYGHITPTGDPKVFADDRTWATGLLYGGGLVAGPDDAMWVTSWTNTIAKIATGLYPRTRRSRPPSPHSPTPSPQPGPQGRTTAPPRP